MNISFIIAALTCLALSSIIIILTFWGFHTKVDIDKTSIYECGFTPYAQARSTYDIKFYLVSLLFIVFDVEVLFLFPLP
jgi:NADH:ubiquinone oxidoreductase subunit 3 (subunit A)